MALRYIGKAHRGLSRSEVVTVRLDPKLRYLVDLAARKQRRTLSSFIEWAVERGLDSVVLGSGNDDASLWQEGDSLWDVDEADRFVKLALRHPELLAHDEQVLWKLIREHGLFWLGRTGNDGKWKWTVADGNVALENLRKHWDVLKAAASGDAEARKQLPSNESITPANSVKKPAGKFDDMEDDIPF